MNPLSDFRFLVAPSVPGAASVVIDNAVLRVCREFCDKTHVWRYEHPAIVMVSGTSDYALTPPVGADVVWINTATQGTHDVRPVGRDLYKKMNPARTTGSVAESLYMLDTANMRVNPTPTGATLDPIALDIVLRPTMTSTTVGAILFSEWAEAIAHGAMAHLMAEPGMNWTDPNTAAYHMSEYRYGIAEAKRRDNYGYASYNNTMQAAQSFL